MKPINKSKPKKVNTIPYHHKPETLSLEVWQKGLRSQYAEKNVQSFSINFLSSEHPVFGDYQVVNKQTGGAYKVALRESEPGINFCNCMDFKTNCLGTCKHIEAVIYKIKHTRKLKKFLKDKFAPSYSSIFLKYGEQRSVMLRIGENNSAEYHKLANKYFDQNMLLLESSFPIVEEFIKQAFRINENFRCYDDALAYILKIRKDQNRKFIIDGLDQKTYFDKILKANLYQYQVSGAIFAAKAGRSLIADEMGLGKTLQAIAVAELLRDKFRIQNVLIICPTSLKYQWKSEIEKFSKNSDEQIAIIEGNHLQRQKQYCSEATYKIISYGVAGIDRDEIRKLTPDLVILDEAQRIKNWQTKTAKSIKLIESEYALVLTGTPLENKLEELYSIIQFIDPFKLGPLYKFLDQHQITDEKGKVTGYRQLNKIKDVLKDIVIRRLKAEVLSELPGRTDQNRFVPLTSEQDEIHQQYAEKVSKLVSKWRRFGFLDEQDRQRLLISLNSMRMVADSTFILDQQTRFDTKIHELFLILETIFSTKEKIVIFSQWERMIRLVKAELEKRGISFAYHHGGIPSPKRKAILESFQSQESCKVFLSTDAGGVGLNLQNASFLINLDLPWNPAVLEQRIGRIYRHGQKNRVSIINLISKNSIEERMLGVLQFKASLFDGVLNNGADQVFMGESRFKRFMGDVEKLAVENISTETETSAEQNIEFNNDIETTNGDQLKLKPLNKSNKVDKAETEDKAQNQIESNPTELFVAGIKLFQKMAKAFDNSEGINGLIKQDAKTGEKFLKIPIQDKSVLKETGAVLKGLASILESFGE